MEVIRNKRQDNGETVTIKESDLRKSFKRVKLASNIISLKSNNGRVYCEETLKKALGNYLSAVKEDKNIGELSHPTED